MKPIKYSKKIKCLAKQLVVLLFNCKLHVNEGMSKMTNDIYIAK